MGNFYQTTDPSVLDQYTIIKARRHRRRRRPLELVRRLDLFVRSLQNLPPRELQMLYQVKALNQEQDELAGLYLVRQSNISFRLARAHARIRLFHQLREITSETALRRAMIEAGVTPSDMTTALCMIKTCSQKFVRQLTGDKSNNVRYVYERVRRVVADHTPNTPAGQTGKDALLRTMDLVQQSWNQLTELAPQSRYAWKRDRSDPAAAPAPNKPVRYGISGSRRTKYRYIGVSRDTITRHFKAFIFLDGKRTYVGTYPDPHQGALATNLAYEFVHGPGTRPENPIKPEDQPDELLAAKIKTTVQDYLTKKGIPPHPDSEAIGHPRARNTKPRGRRR